MLFNTGIALFIASMRYNNMMYNKKVRVRTALKSNVFEKYKTRFESHYYDYFQNPAI